MARAAAELSSQKRLFAKLNQIVSDAGILEGDDIGPRYYEDISHERDGRPSMVVRPKTTEEVSKVLAACHQAGQPLVPQGGMTGLVSAGTPETGEIVLATDRMTQIEELDEASATMTVEAGVPLQAVQEKAAEHQLLFPLDIGARGSCTIGGNLSTNAGGNRVIRYGMMRDLVLGIEAVLADGTILNGLHKLPKNNAGYDLKHLFIGTEGTLGIITRAVLRLRPQPRLQAVAWCSLTNFSQVIELLKHLRLSLGEQLSAFEVLWCESYTLILERVPTVRGPLPTGEAFYVLVEGLGSDPELDGLRFERALEGAINECIIQDAVIAKSKGEIEQFWAVRDGISEAVLTLRPFLSYDVSVAIGDMENFADTLISEIRTRWPNATAGVFGHVGDGNLHLVTDIGEDGVTPRQVVDKFVYEETAKVRGSISAEHGIGFQKKQHLQLSRSEAELAVMKLLKQTLDPASILSSGRVIDV